MRKVVDHNRIYLPFFDINETIFVGKEKIEISIVGIENIRDVYNKLSVAGIARYYSEKLGVCVRRLTVWRRLNEKDIMSTEYKVKNDELFKTVLINDLKISYRKKQRIKKMQQKYNIGDNEQCESQ